MPKELVNQDEVGLSFPPFVARLAFAILSATSTHLSTNVNGSYAATFSEATANTIQCRLRLLTLHSQFLTRLTAAFASPSSAIWLSHKRFPHDTEGDARMDPEDEHDVLLRCTQGETKFSARVSFCLIGKDGGRPVFTTLHGFRLAASCQAPLYRGNLVHTVGLNHSWLADLLAVKAYLPRAPFLVNMF